VNEDVDAELRREAMAWLTIRTNDGLDSISSADLLDFTFRGEPFRLMDAQRGIRKPAILSSALSIRTVYRAPGLPKPYDDEPGPDGLLRYKWRGEDPGHPENVALRAAMAERRPLIWFFGIGPGTYQAIFPVFLATEEPSLQQFVMLLDTVPDSGEPGSVIEGALRRYVMQETKRRLHQPVFRASVLRAYDRRCAVCALGHSELLDAAHIVPDSDDAGIASVRNGLAMCKIHHAAYDRLILGVRPDLVVQIRADLLEEIDGPMLRHGLVERHGQSLMSVPRIKSERPDPDLLELTYQRFLAG
jgi:putative restriction endonuclease